MVSALRSLKHEYDLIHTHQALWESISTGAARPWLGSRPTLVQPASAGYYGEAQEMARTKGFAWLRRLALRNTAFAAISGAIEREWLELGVPPRRMIRTASGVDTDHFSPGEPPAELERELPYRPRAIFTGRLHPQKNLERLLEAWTKLETPATLLLLGEGLDRPRLEQLASGLGLGERVRFVGAVGDPAPWLKASDLFLLPSVAEGMSNSLLEAMATGLPCLVSAIGGNLDLISDGETGRVVSGGDAASWARAIDETLSDRALARTWGANALRRVTSEYSLSTITSRYETLYARLLAES
jgi:glycosyltransferase involved in cell wall biosynthesis